MRLWHRPYLIITTLALCQWVLAQARPGVGNQLDSAPPPGRAVRQLRLPGGFQLGERVTISADTITAFPNRKLYIATGDVRIAARGVTLTADRMRYDGQTGQATASGHVIFDSPGEQTHIAGTRATYNFLASTGEFDNFQGFSGIRMQRRRAVLISNNPLIFSGRKLLRLGPERYRLEDGTLTSCTVPHPIWELSARSADFQLGHNAVLHHAVFRVLNIPLLYAPFLTHSTAHNGRHSGVLVPVISHSTIKGYVLGDSFYWAAARNVNLTVGAALYSARGWADHVQLDSRPTRDSSFGLELDGVFDRGLPQPNGGRISQGGQELLLSGSHQSRSGWRAVLDADYLSSYLYRLVFQNTFSQAINSEAVSTAFVEKQSDGRDFTVSAHRYQDFLGVSPHASLSLAAAPAVDWSAYAQSLSRRLPVYLSWDLNAGLLDRSQPGFATGAMERVDLAPRLTVPVSTALGTFTGAVSVRSTFYSERQNAATTFSAAAAPALLPGHLWRNSASASVTWRPPSLSRVYAPASWGGRRLKHVIAPRFAYHLTTGVQNPNQIIRFDQRDILSNTSELEYGITNRLLAAGPGPAASREILSWTLVQKYFFNPTFGGALVPGARNVLLTTELLSPFSVEALPLRFSPVSSVVRVSPFARFDGQWRLDYDTQDHQVIASAFTGDFHFGNEFISGSQYLLRPPPGLVQTVAVPSLNQFRLSTGYGNALAPGNSLAGSMAYDVHTGRLQYASLELSHNWSCCGFSVEYRWFSLASVRRENQILFSFSLANVGTFGDLRRQDRLF